MKKRRSWVPPGLALAVLQGLASAVQAASAAPAADHPEDPGFARATEKNLAAVFVLPKDLAIDPELRSAADNVTGKTTVSRRFDAQGQAIEAGIVQREIEVGGIRGVRPLAYEDMFVRYPNSPKRRNS